MADVAKVDVPADIACMKVADLRRILAVVGISFPAGASKLTLQQTLAAARAAGGAVRSNPPVATSKASETEAIPRATPRAPLRVDEALSPPLAPSPTNASEGRPEGRPAQQRSRRTAASPIRRSPESAAPPRPPISSQNLLRVLRREDEVADALRLADLRADPARALLAAGVAAVGTPIGSELEAEADVARRGGSTPCLVPREAAGVRSPAPSLPPGGDPGTLGDVNRDAPDAPSSTGVANAPAEGGPDRRPARTRTRLSVASPAGLALAPQPASVHGMLGGNVPPSATRAVPGGDIPPPEASPRGGWSDPVTASPRSLVVPTETVAAVGGDRADIGPPPPSHRVATDPSSQVEGLSRGGIPKANGGTRLIEGAPAPLPDEPAAWSAPDESWPIRGAPHDRFSRAVAALRSNVTTHLPDSAHAFRRPEEAASGAISQPESAHGLHRTAAEVSGGGGAVRRTGRDLLGLGRTPGNGARMPLGAPYAPQSGTNQPAGRVHPPALSAPSRVQPAAVPPLSPPLASPAPAWLRSLRPAEAAAMLGGAAAALESLGLNQTEAAAAQMVEAFGLSRIHAYALLAHVSSDRAPARRLAAPLPPGGDTYASTIARAPPSDEPTLRDDEAPPDRTPVEELVRQSQQQTKAINVLSSSLLEQADRAESRQEGPSSDGQGTLRWAFAQGLSEADPASGITASKGAVQALTLLLGESDRNVNDFGLRFFVGHALITAVTRVQLGNVPIHLFASVPIDELLRTASPLAAPAPKGGGSFPTGRPMTDESDFRDCIANLAHFMCFVYCTAAGAAFAGLGAKLLETLRLNEWFTLADAERIVSSALANFSSTAAKGVNVVTALAGSIPGGAPVNGSSSGLQVFAEIAGARRCSGCHDLLDPWAFVEPSHPDGVYARGMKTLEDLMYIVMQRQASALARKPLPGARARGERDETAASIGAGIPPTAASPPPPPPPDLLPGELVAAAAVAASVASPSGNTRPVCLKYMSHDGCHGSCKRAHVPPPAPLPDILELVLARHGGSNAGPVIPPASRGPAVERLRSKLTPASRTAVSTAAGSTRGRGHATSAGFDVPSVVSATSPSASPAAPAPAAGPGLSHAATAPPTDLHGAAGSSHVLEQPLAATFEAPPRREQPAARFVAVTNVPDSPRKLAMRQVRAHLIASVAGFTRLHDDLQAYGTHLIATWLAGAEPTAANVSGLLGRVASQFGSSSHPGAKAAALLLQPGRSTSTAGRDLLRATDKATVFPRPPAPNPGEPPTEGVVQLLGETFRSHDFGDVIGVTPDGRAAGNQCVLVALAAILGVDKHAFAARMRAEASLVFGPLAPLSVPTMLSMDELQCLQHAHDLTRPAGYGPGIDALCVLYFGAEMFAQRRLYILTLNGTGAPIDAYCIEPPGFCEARGQGSSLLLLIGGHAYVGQFPPRFGRHAPAANGAPAPINHAAAKAFERTLVANGVTLRRLHPPSADELAVAPKVIDASTLDMCDCCGYPLRLWGTRAGRVPIPILPTTPPRLAEFGQTWCTYGGLSSPLLRHCAKDLGKIRREVAGLSDDDICSYPFPPAVADLARTIQAAAGTALKSISKASVKSDDRAALDSLSSALCAAMSDGDELVALAGSVPLAIAALRQARFERGERTLDPSRLLANSHMFPRSTFGLLCDLAIYGAPLLQISRFPPGARQPAPSAEVVAGQIGRDALAEVAAGLSIIVSAGKSDPHLAAADVVYNRVAAVPKKPDSSGGPPAYRTITNARPFNTLNAADDAARRGRGILITQPPSACPSFADVARCVVHYSARYPGLAVMISVQDGKSAYKCFNLPVGDACSQAMQLPTRNLSLRGAVPVLVCASGVFGAQFASGWYGVGAHAVADAVSSSSPQEPFLDGTGNAVGQIHVDDHVHIGVDLGDNLPHAKAAYEQVHAVVFGEGKLNADKGDGTFTSKAKFWGRVVDLSGLEGAPSVEAGLAACSLGTDAVKYVALAEALDSPAFKLLERRRVSLTEHEHVKGLVQWLSGTSMVMRTTLGALHEMSSSTHALYVSPIGTAAAVDLKWSRYAHVLAILRAAASSPEHCTVGLLSPLLGCLTVSEQVAFGRELSWLASDGCLVREDTPSALGEAASSKGEGSLARESAGFSFADHGLKIWAAHDAVPFMDALRARVGDDLPTIIYIIELLGLTCAAYKLAEDWRGKLKAYAIDNSPAYYGLQKFYSRHPFAGFCYQVIAKALARVGCDLYPFWVATDNNPFADMGSRDVLTLSPVELESRVVEFYPGYRRIDFSPVIREILFEGFGSVPTVVAGGLRQPVSDQRVASGLTFFEAFPGPLATGSVAAIGLGFACVGFYEPCPDHRAAALSRLGVSGPSETAAIGSTRAHLVARLPPSIDCLLVAGVPRSASEGTGFFGGGLLQLIDRMCPRILVIELRAGQLPAGGQELSSLDEELARRGLLRSVPVGVLSGGEQEVETIHFATDLGGAHTGIRCLLQYEREGVTAVLPDLLPPRGWQAPIVLQDVLEPYHLLPLGCGLPPGHFKPSPSKPRLGVPISAGSYTLPGGPAEGATRGDRVKLHGRMGFWVVQRVLANGLVTAQAEESSDGPGRTESGKVAERLPRKIPVFNVAGPALAPHTWGHYPEGPSRTLILDARGPTPMVRCLTAREAFRLQGHADAAYEHVATSVTGLWRQTAVAAASLSGLVAEAVLRRVTERLRFATGLSNLQGHPTGSGPSGDPDESVAGDSFYAPTRARGGERHAGRPRGLLSREGIRSDVAALVAGSISSGTTSTYASQVHHWWRWRVGCGAPPYLEGSDPVADQESLVQFVAYVGVKMRYRHASVRVMLYAVRYHHIVGRRPDPLVDTPLLRIVMVGLKRLQGGRRQKVPVTVHIMRECAQGLDLDDWDDLILLLGISLMFVFLLRSREALRKGAHPDAEQCMRVRSLMLARDGVPVAGAPDDADELILHIPKSKADQEGLGFIANAFETAGDPLCPVALLKRARLMKPQHFAQPDNFLLVRSDGRVLSRDAVVDALRPAASALGVPPESLSVISLRAGGASAMWDAGFSVDEIKRRGRWASECWRIYTWEGRERARSVAARMFASSVSVLGAVARFARE